MASVNENAQERFSTEGFQDKQVAALKAELRTETHFALLRQAKIRELRAEKAEYELEKRQLKHMLVAAIEKHAETARQLQTTQEVLPKLVESFERQHEALAKCADREQSLREEVTELRVLAESARFYHEEQTKTLRKQLAQAARTPLTDYISGVNDGLFPPLRSRMTPRFRRQCTEGPPGAGLHARGPGVLRDLHGPAAVGELRLRSHDVPRLRRIPPRVPYLPQSDPRASPHLPLAHSRRLAGHHTVDVNS